MSAVAASPSSTAGGADAGVPRTAETLGEACPLCGAPLQREQDWCLSCGAAARTRLAASPGWRGPIVALAVVLVLSLGVLAGSLVKLAGGTAPAKTQTTTITTAAAATTTATQGALAPQTLVPSTPAKAQPGLKGTATITTPTTTSGAPSATKPNTRIKGSVGGINLSHVKQPVAERLRALQQPGK
jgi:hypothetical protein